MPKEYRKVQANGNITYDWFEYTTDIWPSKLVPYTPPPLLPGVRIPVRIRPTERWVSTRPEGRSDRIKHLTGFAAWGSPEQKLAGGNWWQQTYSPQGAPMWEYIDDDQAVMDLELTGTNSHVSARYEQALVLENHGYHGPIGGSEARALKRLFISLGRPEMVRLGHATREITTKNSLGHDVKSTRLLHCYVFKTPVDAVPFDKFIQVARWYKDDEGGMRQAVVKLMENPEEAQKMATVVDTLDAFGKMESVSL